MSVFAMAAVWRESKHAGTDLLMLLAIADYADDQGRAYPSVSTLAKKCRMQDRNAKYLLARLRDSGELRAEINAGPHGSNAYRIVLPSLQGVQNLAPPPVQSAAPRGAKPCTQPVQSAAPKPSLNQTPNTRTAKPRAEKLEMTVDQLVADGLTEQTAREYLALRREKRCRLTPRAWADVKAHLAKAGMEPEPGVVHMLGRGWAGFNSAWSNAGGTPRPASRALHDNDIFAGAM